MKPDTELKLVKTTKGAGYVSRQYKEVKISEANIQATLKQALEALGYIVGELNKGRNAKGSVFFQTVGMPDLFITHHDWPTGEWLGLELKTPTGKIREAQARLHEQGRTVIARSVRQGLEAVAYVERKLDANTPLAAPGKRKERVMDMAGQFEEVGL
jgi:hypothetical protein